MEKTVAEQAAILQQNNPVPAEKSSEKGKRSYTDKFDFISTRPSHLTDKRGKSGQVVHLMTNYIPVGRKSNDVVVQYQVAYDPTNLTVPQKCRLVHEWAKNSVKLDISDYTFDRNSLIYVGPKGFAILKEEVQWTGKIDVDGKSQEIEMRIFKVATLDPKNDKEFKQILVQLNTQLNRFLERELHMVRILETCYDPSKKMVIAGHNIEVWPGFDASISKFDSDTLLMSVDQRFRIIRKETAMQFLQAAFMSSKSRGRSVEDSQKDATNAIKGSVVETPYNHIAYKVDDVDWTRTPASTFPTRKKDADGKFLKGKDGEFIKEEISFAQYFKQRYNGDVRDLSQPMLLVKPSNKAMRRRRDDVIALIPEFCNMTGLTDKMKADFRLMKAVAVNTKLSPEPRRLKVLEFVRALAAKSEIQNQLASWGTSYGTELVQLQGRTLNPLPIFQGERKIPDYQKADWLTGIRGSRADSAGKAIGNNWLCLHFNQLQLAQNFARELATVAGPMGQNIGQPNFVDVGGNSPSHYLNAAMQHGNASIALVMAIFPDNAVDRYSNFKQQFCCTAPCITQVMLSKTISEAKSLKSVATKVAMQIIAKVGGLLWKLKFGFTGPTTVVGIDVHRDRVEKRMVVAACASWNRDISGYMNFSDFADENDEDDIHAVVARLIKTVVEKFKEPNNTYPHHVMLYRDGVSEGQLPNIVKKEIPLIREMLATVTTPKPITLTYIMLNKRDSSRFFCNPSNNNGNPLPGTIIDSVVTRPYRYDFYIVSQTVREGTVGPTYYDVLVDDSNMPPEVMQTCTYMLCHMYFNWPGTIRVPAPNQYARKHAQMVALSLHRTADSSLFNKMFYL